MFKLGYDATIEHIYGGQGITSTEATEEGQCTSCLSLNTFKSRNYNKFTKKYYYGHTCKECWSHF